MKIKFFSPERFKRLVIITIVSWLVLFVLLPNLMVIIISFLTSNEADLVSFTFTLNNYRQLFDPLYAEVLWHSLTMAVITTIICLLLGYPFAFLLAKLPQKIQPILLFLLIIPFWTNSLIRIYGLKVFIGAKGVLNTLLLNLGVIEKPLRLMFTQEAVIMGLVYILLPFMILPLYSSIEKLDKNYIEAAQDLGANRYQRFIQVILPLTTPGIIAGCLLVILPAMGMFYVSDLLGGAKNLLVGNIIKDQILRMRDWPFGSATSICLTLFMGILLFVYYRVGKLLNKKVELE